MNIILFDSSEITIEKNLKVTSFLPRRDVRAVHLLKVLHKNVGDSFSAGVFGGKTGSGVITEISETGLLITLNLNTEPLPRTPLHLGVGFPRPIQLRRLLRDCASMGLTTVDLISTELGEKSYRDTKLLDDGGASSALMEGAVQARDTRLPELAVYSSLSTWLQKDFSQRRQGINSLSKKALGTVLLAADNVRSQGSFSELKPFQKNTEAVLAVGSERGWSDREREQLESAGFTRLSLGQRALRTETACIAATILVMEKMGLLNLR